MKLISLYQQDKLITAALQNDREAQEQLYRQHAPKMLTVCRQYVSDVHQAEELMLQGFLKVFTKLSSYKHSGSFEGWIRRIMVNTCISHLRTKDALVFCDILPESSTNSIQSEESSDVDAIQALIDALPTGYKMVFQLFAVEGYSHAEIATKLQISESTSKSQLFKARKLLQKKYEQLNTVAYGTH